MKLKYSLLIVPLIYLSCNKTEKDNFKENTGTFDCALPLYLSPADTGNSLLGSIIPEIPAPADFTNNTISFSVNSNINITIIDYQGIQIKKKDTTYFLKILGAYNFEVIDSNTFFIRSSLGKAVLSCTNNQIKAVSFNFNYVGAPLTRGLRNYLTRYYNRNANSGNPRIYFICPKKSSPPVYGWFPGIIQNPECYCF